MKIGLPRQNTLITWPAAIGARSTSIGAPAAMVEASGFICATSGTSTAAAPTAPATPVAMKRKSRRVGSAEDVIVTVRLLLVLAMKPLALGTREGCKRTGRAGPETGRTALSGGVLLAPLVP